MQIEYLVFLTLRIFRLFPRGFPAFISPLLAGMNRVTENDWRIHSWARVYSRLGQRSQCMSSLGIRASGSEDCEPQETRTIRL
jgi:hypothetical protein